MSKSIAYWYIKLTDGTEEIVFPIDDQSKKTAYKLLRLDYKDADIIITPENNIYEINKDVYIEDGKYSFMFFLTDVSKSKRSEVCKLHKYILTNNWKGKIQKNIKWMQANKIPYSILLITSLEVMVNMVELCNLVRDYTKDLSYLHLKTRKIIELADITYQINHQQIMVLLSDISIENTKRKQAFLKMLIKKYFKNSKVDIKAFYSADYLRYSDMKKHINNEYNIIYEGSKH